MALFKIVLFVTFTLICFENTVAIKPSRNLILPEKMNKSTFFMYKIMKNLLYCFPDNLNPVIMSNVAGKQLKKHFDLDHPKSLILIDEDFEQVEGKIPWTDYYSRTPIFVVVFNGINNLIRIMKHIFWSNWGITDPTIIVVDLNDCSYRVAVLQPLWEKFTFSFAVYLCFHIELPNLRLYTLNPHTGYAPTPWVKQNENPPYALFVRCYKQDLFMCFNLFYDKSRYFRGYKMDVFGLSKPGMMLDTKLTYNASSLIEVLPYTDAQYAIHIFKRANITPLIHYNEPHYKPYRYEYFLNSTYLKSSRRIFFPCYPHRQVAAVIITHKRPFLSIGERIQSLYSLLTIFLIIIAFGTLSIALMFNKKQPYLSAVMEMIRLLVSSGSMQQFNKIPLRILLFSIFLLVIITNMIFAGKILEFLTKPERLNVNSLADLKKFGHRVFVSTEIWPLLIPILEEIELPAEKLESFDELDMVYTHYRTALILTDSLAYELAYTYQLHVSEPCLYFYSHYVLRWPFQKITESMTSRFAEHGLRDYWIAHETYRYKLNLTNTEKWEAALQIRPLDMFNLLFIFKFWAVGLGVSLLVFLGEIYVDRKQKNRAMNTTKINVVPLTED